MFNIHKEELTWGGKKLVLETGKIARQADGAVMVTYGNTQVLAVATAAKKANPEVDFFPLTVLYQEKAYAAGRIPGGFLKREGRPSERETLASRLIDRPIRPLFPDDFRNETQVVCTVVSHDSDDDPEIAAMIGASAALTISGVPFMGPIAASRVGYTDGEFVLNPTHDSLADSDLNLMVAGTQKGVLMVESQAVGLPEDIMLDAVMFGHEQMQPVIKSIIGLAEKCAKEPWDLEDRSDELKSYKDKIAKAVEKDLRAAYALTIKQERSEKISQAKETALASFDKEDENFSNAMFGRAFKKLESDIVRKDLLKTKKRIDGRAPDQVRQIECEVGILGQTHGSALFTRGETQALVVTTLGTGDDEQFMDQLEGEYRSRFMLHYNFPPYSVGEVGRMGGAGRREIGHGKLAWRSVVQKLPTAEAFPYTIRTVSEITESNGSSSMATVCGTSLSMMDAGVPLESSISGIAMGLIKEGDDFIVLSDIMGDEDHLGDMDFKVAGDKDGITALQMDLKITSVDKAIMKTALEQAKVGRLHILKEMAKAIKGSRDEVNDNAPRIENMNVPVDKIREVIGTGGKVIRELCETHDVKINIEDDGSVRVYGSDSQKTGAAVAAINNIIAVPEVGETYDGVVSKIADFGAFVDFLNTTGLLHISELEHKRVEKVTDVLNVGDKVKVKVLGLDRGKVKLSRKALIEKPASDKDSKKSDSEE
jgi:polyribonucleotide nucleotidyltransferase